MVAAPIHHDLGAKPQRAAGATHGVLNISRVGALLHPNALFNRSVSAGECPHRNCTFHAKTFDVQISVGINHTTGPTVGSESITLTGVFHDFIYFGNQQSAVPGRRQSAHQQTVVAARQRARQRAARKSSNAIRDQPFALFRSGKVAADVTSKVNDWWPGMGGGHDLYPEGTGERWSQSGKVPDLSPSTEK